MARRRTDLVKADARPPEAPGSVPEQPGAARHAAPYEARRDAIGPVEPDAFPAGEGESEGADGGAAAPESAAESTMALARVEPGARTPEQILAEPPDARDVSAELAAPPRRKLPWLTLALSAGVVAALGFTGGALVEKHHVQNNPTAGRFGGATNGRGFSFGGAGAATGASGGSGSTAGGGASAFGGLTVGTVKLVDGNTIYVADAQGNVTKITTTKSTKVTESTSGKVSDLKAGDTVTVLGTKKSSGDVAATTVTEGSGTGGFGGFGGGRFGGGTGGGGGTGAGAGSGSGS
jgi:hypothetical protein